MRKLLQVVAPLLALLLGTVALPAAAAEAAAGASPATATATAPAAAAQPAAPAAPATAAPMAGSQHHFTAGKVAAIIAGAVIVGTAADMTLSGGIFTVVGVVVGAALGSVWYERGMWPF
jgi:hypothetical protein